MQGELFTEGRPPAGRLEKCLEMRARKRRERERGTQTEEKFNLETQSSKVPKADDAPEAGRDDFSRRKFSPTKLSP